MAPEQTRCRTTWHYNQHISKRSQPGSQLSNKETQTGRIEFYSPTTMMVKCAPRLATILCLYNGQTPASLASPLCNSKGWCCLTWLGRLAMPIPSEKGAAIVEDVGRGGRTRSERGEDWQWERRTGSTIEFESRCRPLACICACLPAVAPERALPIFPPQVPELKVLRVRLTVRLIAWPSHSSLCFPSSLNSPPNQHQHRTKGLSTDCCQHEPRSSGAEHPDVEGQEAHQEPRRRQRVCPVLAPRTRPSSSHLPERALP